MWCMFPLSPGSSGLVGRKAACGFLRLPGVPWNHVELCSFHKCLLSPAEDSLVQRRHLEMLSWRSWAGEGVVVVVRP